jgi:acyl carrier protein
MEVEAFLALLSKSAKTDIIAPESILFGAGLNLSSIAFLEFIMELEEVTGLDIDVDDLDASIRTAGQLHDRLFP